MVWFNPDLKKGDHHYVGYLCIQSSTRVVEMPKTTKPEESLAKVERKVMSSIPREDMAFSIFNLTIMFELWTSAICYV